MSLKKSHLAAFLLASGMAFGIAEAAPGHFQRHEGPMMQLRRLDLTEAQRDQVFKIFHAQAPAFHEQMKQLRQARTTLRDAANSDRYDAGKAQAAADAQGKATAQLALLRVQTAQQVRAILTPEQRTKLDEMRSHARERHAPRGERK